MGSPKPDFWAILQTLSRHEVDFIVVGGVCAVLHGAPVSTFDIDIVHARTENNLERLVKALGELDASYREHPAGRIQPTKSSMSTTGHHLLVTSAGPLDLLGTVTGGRAYEDLISQTLELTLNDDLTVRILELPMLITLKEEMGREKDRAVLPILRRTLDEKQKGGE